jgi:cell division protein FtsW
MIVYLAGYLLRQEKQVQNQIRGFLKPLMVLAVITFLLLREPDFGAATVILLTSLGMLFLAGVRIWQFVILLVGVAVILVILAISSPYRLARLTTFLNPWANQFDSGYQLTQSLIAFGRGGWFGVGLGESIQKLFYLPEAHTDFLFAVLSEELGLIGGLFMICLFSLLVFRALHIGKRCFNSGQRFSAYLAYGIGLNIALQVMINIGVNTGVLPTKGLTLPLMSYGGSSLLITCIMLALLLRIDYEYRLIQFGFRVSD